MALIMIVDDSPTEVHVLKTALEKHGFDTVSAADGSECLSLAREVRPDLIFMDVVMPRVNGLVRYCSDPTKRPRARSNSPSLLDSMMTGVSLNTLLCLINEQV